MRIDQLYQFLVPLTFLAIWALTSLLNRDAQPLPPRVSGRPPGPYGPGHAHERATKDADDRRADPFRRETRPQSPRPRPALSADDGIVILEPNASVVRPGRAGTQNPRRAGRGKPTPQAQPKKKEAGPRQTFGAPLSSAPLTGSSVQQRQTLVPLSLEVATTIAETTSIQTSRIESPRTRPVERKAVSIEEIHELLRSPARVGEAFILSELLSPPLALRGPRNRR